MIILNSIINLAHQQSFQHLSILILFFFITWIYTLKGKFLIDDHEGVERFTDRWIQTKDPTGKIIKEEKIDYYEENGKRWKNFEFNTALNPYQAILRFIRTNFGKKFTVIGKNENGHEIYGYVQDPFRHHLLSLTIQLANIILAYSFLSKILGANLAFNATLLFLVHPISCQVIAWISGIGYMLSFLFAMIMFNISLVIDSAPAIPIFGIMSFLSCSALLSGFANPVILFMLHKPYALSTACFVSIYMLLTWGKEIVTVRKKAFHEQDMAKSTKFNWRKPFIIIKTFFYYLMALVFPKRLGLFHVWGYHYDEKLERIDNMFWLGLLSLAGMGFLYFLSPFPVKFGIIWLFSYLILFSNLITAQQFVADRYAFFSSFGYSILVAYFLKDYPIIFSFIIGLYMMRTLVHLPTFLNDKNLYESNIFNFPKSEVAYGNLGVILNALGRGNGAVDAWQASVAVNPFYDVPHYNLSSMMKASGQFDQAYNELKACLKSKTVHFRATWEKEMKELELNLSKQKAMNALNDEINVAINTGKYELINSIKERMAALQGPPPTANPPITKGS